MRQVRLAGDRNVLVEYGPMELDLRLRIRIWALQKALANAKVFLAAYLLSESICIALVLLNRVLSPECYMTIRVASVESYI